MQDGQNPTPTDNSPRDPYRNIRPVKRSQLINKLNYVNFNEGFVLVVFEHGKYAHTVSLKALPHPCIGDELECTWPESELETYRTLNAYHFREIQIPDGKDTVVIRPEDIFINGKVANFLLPEKGFELRSRVRKRFDGNDITAQLVQNGIAFEGRLKDFNRTHFRVEVEEQNQQALFWINRQQPINLMLTTKDGIVFSGECALADARNGLRTRKNFILAPSATRIQRFAKKDYRAVRYNLVPTPYVIFSHPLTRRTTSLNVVDISGSGFSIKEDAEGASLVPGMILKEIEIRVAGTFCVKCDAQVIHQGKMGPEDDPGCIRTGLAILNMDMTEHGRLLGLLHQAKNPHSFLSGNVDEDALWRFFFESGFIYPQKYRFIHENKEALKETYRKIYTQAPHIARHFTYQDRGEILGHLAMIRFFERSWLIQHHAAFHHNAMLAGVTVLDQIGRFINESSSLFSMYMDYVFCYFRPENKFPHQVFGGAARNINDPRICSLDDFAYFHYARKSGQAEPESRAPWRLSPAGPEDLMELKLFYEKTSGGNMLKALELLPETADLSRLIDTYTRSGFKRDRMLFALKRDNRLKAVFVLNFSDFGLNLSDVTNSIHLFVTDPEAFSNEALANALSELSSHYDTGTVPVLVYPRQNADMLNIAYEKVYQLWVLDARRLDYYFEFMKRFFRKLNSIQPGPGADSGGKT